MNWTRTFFYIGLAQLFVRMIFGYATGYDIWAAGVGTNVAVAGPAIVMAILLTVVGIILDTSQKLNAFVAILWEVLSFHARRLLRRLR